MKPYKIEHLYEKHYNKITNQYEITMIVEINNKHNHILMLLQGNKAYNLVYCYDVRNKQVSHYQNLNNYNKPDWEKQIWNKFNQIKNNVEKRQSCNH